MKQVRLEDLRRFQRFFSPVEAYAAALAVSAFGLAVGLWAAGFRISAPPLALVVLASTALLAEKQRVRVATHTEMSVSVLPILFAAVLFGPLTAMIVGGCGTGGTLTAGRVGTLPRSIASSTTSGACGTTRTTGRTCGSTTGFAATGMSNSWPQRLHITCPLCGTLARFITYWHWGHFS